MIPGVAVTVRFELTKTVTENDVDVAAKKPAVSVATTV
jgi:hypothetical protein